MNMRIEQPSRWNAFAWGLTLVALGVVFMLHFLGRLDWEVWGVWWPGIPVFLGFMQAITARSARTLGGGVTLMGIGAYLMVSANGWYGLDWHNSWPLALVAVGLGSIVRAIASPFMPARSRWECANVEVSHDER